MATGDSSSPIRFGKGQSDPVNNRELYLDVFGGEVLTAFDLATITADKHTVKNVGPGQRSWRFPKTWKASSEYHTPGTELLGTDIETGEITITVDDILVSHTGFSDLDTMLTHFDVRQPFSEAMGRELAKVYDKNVFRQLTLAARAASDGPFPGGSTVVDSALANSGSVDGAAWIDAIREANKALFEKDVPEDGPRYMAVNWDVFDAIKYAKDANGQYLVLNRDFEHSGAGRLENRAEVIKIDGVMIYRTRNMPTTDESAETSVYTKYRADYSGTLGLLWHPMAAATVKLMDIGFETTRDTRRLEDFMVAKMLCGLGTLRPECAVEFRAAALA